MFGTFCHQLQEAGHYQCWLKNIHIIHPYYKSKPPIEKMKKKKKHLTWNLRLLMEIKWEKDRGSAPSVTGDYSGLRPILHPNFKIDSVVSFHPAGKPTNKPKKWTQLKNIAVVIRGKTWLLFTESSLTMLFCMNQQNKTNMYCVSWSLCVSLNTNNITSQYFSRNTLVYVNKIRVTDW